MKKFIAFALMALMFIVASTSVNAARYRVTCSYCDGSGTIMAEETYPNPYGWMEDEDLYITEEVEMPCPECDGKGYVYVNK